METFEISRTDEELYVRMERNLLASWSADAAPGSGAAVRTLAGAWAAVFPKEPERAYFNNALLVRGLEAQAVVTAVEAVEAAYADAQIERFAVWAHEADGVPRAQLEARGYRIDTTTRAMALNLSELVDSGADPRAEPGSWSDYLDFLEAEGSPPGLLNGVDGAAYEVLTAEVDGTTVAAALAFDHDGDCGIYNVGTMPHARRRGLGTALTAAHLVAARARGCSTASLQATPIAERVYAHVGFRSLGRFIEYTR